MSYVEILIDFAKRAECPGCGPTMTRIDQSSESDYRIGCICCGWQVGFFANENGGKEYSFLMDGAELNGYRCVLDHPEHRARWPKPERDNNQEDEFTKGEILQKIVEDNPRHPGIIYPETKCVLCGAWAPHLVEETTTTFDFSKVSSAELCCYCFKSVFGPKAHTYNEIHKSPVDQAN
jgi:hypothetical protein